MSAIDVNALGKVGPRAIAELAAREWDAIVVGGGHTAAHRGGVPCTPGSRSSCWSVETTSAACTLEQPFPEPGYLVSPCAYVVGMLDELVVGELDLRRHGYEVLLTDPNAWCPFPDGTSFAQFPDDERTVAHMRENGFSEQDIRGAFAYEETFGRARSLLREGPLGDTWKRPSPTRRSRLLGDEELISIVFESIADTIDRYVDDQRLKDALFGQGVIGAYAGPRDPGTASVHLMHSQGEVEGRASEWGYVVGGMGRVSFAIAEAALEAGATLATGVPVARIVPGEGVELESGDRLRAAVVVSNADPKRNLDMLEPDAVPSEYRERLERWKVRSSVVKLNAALTLPTFTAAGDLDPLRAMISIQHGLDAPRRGSRRASGASPRSGSASCTARRRMTPRSRRRAAHTMSAFCCAPTSWRRETGRVGGRRSAG